MSAGDAGSSSTGLFIEVLNKYLYFYSAGNQVRAGRVRLFDSYHFLTRTVILSGV